MWRADAREDVLTVLGAVLAAVLVRYGDLGSNVDVVLAGVFAGVLVGVGALDPLS